MMDTPTTLNSGMCRCCSSEGTFKDIKTKYHWMGEEEIYADMLTDCFDIKILTPEDTDNGICEVCITQLRNAANFKKQVLHTEEQFKRRFCNKDNKNPIKLESADEEPMDSDHLSDPDFSGGEYDVPIKEEIEEKPKSKKRTAKATTSRAKKAKSEPESSDQHVLPQNSICIIETSYEPSDKQARSVESEKKQTPKIPQLTGSGFTGDTSKNRKNLEIIMRNSNATPTSGFHGIGYGCFFCLTQYLEPASLKAHTLKYHKDLKHAEGTRLKKLYSYSIKLDITSLTCNICLEPFEKLNVFVDHLRNDHCLSIHTDMKNYLLPFKFDSDPMKCTLCETEFSTFRMAVEHMNMHYRNFVCEICDSGFVNRSSWRAHMRNHEQGEFPCEECPQVFNSLIRLKYHTRGVHLGQNKRNKCAYCGEKFICLVVKNNHMLRAHGVSPPVAHCKACDKTFASNDSLRMHKKSYHLLEKNYKCAHCEMSFAGKNTLDKHMVKHTGAKDFKCVICDKAFGRKYTLTQHMRIHADDRKYKCAYCKMAFVQKCSLKSHLLSKHGRS